MNNRKKIIICLVAILILGVLGTTYALWQVNKNIDEQDEVAAACINLAIENESDDIVLANEVPTPDDVGINKSGYKFTIHNDCTSTVRYNINLESLSEIASENRADINHIKVALYSDDALIDKDIVGFFPEGDSNLESGEAYDTRILSTEYLAAGESKNYELKLWLNNSAPNSEQGKLYNSKVTVYGVATNKELFTTYLTKLAKKDKTNLRYDETVDNNLRFIGRDPNNYIWFNNELWRIIGVMNNIDDGTGNKESRVKIIRADSIGGYQWASNNKNNWATATLNTYLNGDYYNSLNNKDYIADAVYNLGSYRTDLTASGFYTAERGTDIYSGNPTTWTGKIGLMYPSDYGFSTTGLKLASSDGLEYGSDLSDCLKIGLKSWSTTQGVDYSNKNFCPNGSWIFNSSYNQWTMTPRADGASYVTRVGTSGSVSYNDTGNGFGVRPVLYLKSSVVVADGNGTKSNPYKIKTETPIKNGNATRYIKSLYNNGDTSLVYDGTSDNNLRYVGRNPKNYVSFNGELWRIIGVMNNVDGGTASGDKATRVKIIRNDSLGDISWDRKCLAGDNSCGTSTDTSVISYNNNWETASVNTLLNTAYLNRTTSTTYNYINNSWQYADYSSNGLSEASRNLLEEATYYLGGYSVTSSASNYYLYATANTWYSTIERGSAVYSGNPTSWTGVVALMYPSDYAFATAGGTTTNRSACMAKELYNWGATYVRDCRSGDWLYNSSISQWTITSRADNAYYVAYVYTGGSVYSGSTSLAFGLRPVLYLKSTTKIMSGQGTSAQPYQLGV